MKIKLADDVFYRKYDSSYYVWRTSIQDVSLVNEMAFDIIQNLTHNFEEGEVLIKKLSKIYELNKINVKAIEGFIYELIDIGILVSDKKIYGNADIDNQLTLLTVQKHILCNVMFELTYNCNEKCKHCYVERTDNRDNV
jgi:hypothetical protein